MEKALLVTVYLSSRKDSEDSDWTPEEKALELKELATSCGALVVAEEIVKRVEIDPAYYIGTGKAEELGALCRELGANIVIFNNDLSGTQSKNLEESIGVKIIDRTELILDIFARRARSNEGKIQVELAQLMHKLPKMTGAGVEMDRTGGGIGTIGPGEQKLEIDRRRINERIIKLKKALTEIKKQRQTGRKQRDSVSLLNAAIIGYTNAGKSTLLNTLTGSGVIAEDRLFSTLDPTVRKYTLPNNQNVMFTDTVGFLDRLPHHLVEAFKATLEEVVMADILIHVMDASHHKLIQHRNAVLTVLTDLGVMEKPIIQVLNKVDKITDPIDLNRIEESVGEAITISALKGIGLDKLTDVLVMRLSKIMVKVTVEVSQSNVKLVSFMHERANIIKMEYKGETVYFEAEIPERYKKMFDKLI